MQANTSSKVFPGLDMTEGVTFFDYTSNSIRAIHCAFHDPRESHPSGIYDPANWVPKVSKPAPTLTEGISVIDFEDIEALKDQLAPADKLDLSALAMRDIIPIPSKHSFPDVSIKHGRLATSTIRVHSIDDIHKVIERKILPNLHYSHRLRSFLYQWGKLQYHPDHNLDLVPGMSDDAAGALLNGLDAGALQRKWSRTRIFKDEDKEWKTGRKLGLASWLWCDGAAMAQAQANNFERPASTGSVLFTYIPEWFVSFEHLERFSKETPFHLRPSWFAAIHNACIDSGTRHLIVYTGPFVVIGIFNASFTSVAFSPPMPVDVSDEYGYGVNSATGLDLQDPERQPYYLVQVLSQVMFDAVAVADNNNNANMTTTAAFPSVPLASNNNAPLAAHRQLELIRHAMRFSVREAMMRSYPTLEEIRAMRAACGGELPPWKPHQPGRGSSDDSSSSGSSSPLVSRKRQREGSPASTLPVVALRTTAPRHILPHPHRLASSIRTTPATGSARRRAEVEKTRTMDLEMTGMAPPAKRVRFLTPEPVAPAAAPVAGPSSSPSPSPSRRSAARNAKLANVANSKKVHDIKTKAKGLKIAAPISLEEVAPVEVEEVVDPVVKIEEEDVEMAVEEIDESEVEDMMVLSDNDDDDNDYDTADKGDNAAIAVSAPMANASLMAAIKSISRLAVAAKVKSVAAFISAGIRFVLRAGSMAASSSLESGAGDDESYEAGSRRSMMA
ncbi:hypothetical protein FRB96_000666 [Tulasnella sp. 330]|nr:hypothetical protein FRB96_000666 [Tulasnella sp. 330]KAG8872817.1 hypothetical protein FRB97_007333 [Tulasnella sp. 331]